ncbi:MAG: 2-amino-4-hydroxy-6-hydroxymethyldihydropteridine diphosphokinase [Gammaproteobacteria bacterium]
MSGQAPRWRPAYVGLGSNLESPRVNVESAAAALGDIEATRLIRLSPLYRSAPMDGSEQPDYINAVAALLTRLDVRGLLEHLRRIELERGRVRGGDQWRPRIIDLDLLIYSTAVIDEEDLKVPHPGVAERNFVLLPLADIAPHLNIPGLGSVASLAGRVDRCKPRIERQT